VSRLPSASFARDRNRQPPVRQRISPVRCASIHNCNEPSRVTGAVVTFEPAARTAWHMHPLGQTLIVTSGTGWVCQWGGPLQEIKQGDVVWIPPGVKHWHGATVTDRMTHIAIQESLAGKNVQWMEHVSEEQHAVVSTSAQAALSDGTARARSSITCPVVPRDRILRGVRPVQ
jgi:quercetin dioxygenase-like cupin family protein